MIRLLLIILFFLSSSPAYAEWVKIGGSDAHTIYADSDTIRRNGNLVKMWTLLDFKTIHTAGGTSYLSQKQQLEYDCAEEQLRSLAYYWYSGQIGTGKIVDSYAKPLNWEPSMPDSAGQVQLAFACKNR
jgi:hypothetical protein